VLQRGAVALVVVATAATAANPAYSKNLCLVNIFVVPIWCWSFLLILEQGLTCNSISNPSEKERRVTTRTISQADAEEMLSEELAGGR
jgi:hypothetical protein